MALQIYCNSRTKPYQVPIYAVPRTIHTPRSGYFPWSVQCSKAWRNGCEDFADSARQNCTIFIKKNMFVTFRSLLFFVL